MKKILFILVGVMLGLSVCASDLDEQRVNDIAINTACRPEQGKAVCASEAYYVQAEPKIDVFSSITLNEDETVTVTPHHPLMWCSGENCGDVVVLHKGEAYSFAEQHVFGSVTYKGIIGDKLLFEEMSGFDAMSFGGDIKRNTKEVLVLPYTKEQFIHGREKEFLQHVKLNESNREEIAELINKTGMANELLWTNYSDMDYVKFLVKNGADINYTNEEGKTILFPLSIGPHGCAYKADIFHTLINLGIDAHHKDNRNKEALDYLKEQMKQDGKECLFVLDQILNANGKNPMSDAETCNSLPDFEFIGGQCIFRCPKNTFRRGDGNCSPCTTLHTEGTSQEECNKCPERGYDNQECFLKTCPRGTFRTWAGCTECVGGGAYSSTEKECLKCSNRIYENGNCLHPCPEGEFRDRGGICTRCDYPVRDLSAKEKECLKCSNRIYKNGKCSLK